MARTRVRQDNGVRNSDTYDDTLSPGSALETTGEELEFDLNAIRSMLKRIIHGADPGNWFDDPVTVFTDDASLKALLNKAGSIVVRRNSGADVGTRPRLNFIEGANIALTITDDAVDDEIDIVIESTASLDEDAHEVLDTLTHDIVEDSYEEVSRDPSLLIETVTTWTDNTKTTKIREELITRNAQRLITQIVRIQYDGLGVEKYRLTETISRTGTLRPRVESITRVRT